MRSGEAVIRYRGAGQGDERQAKGAAMELAAESKRRIARLALVLLAIAWPLSWAPAAHADEIDVRIEQLESDKDYKLRLSAVVWLAKKSDPRAIAALATVVAGDQERSVRQVAARALGKLVDGNTPEREREQAITALERAAKEDTSSRVRRAAKRSLERLIKVRQQARTTTSASSSAAGSASGRASGSAPGRASGKSGRSRVFINVGKPQLGKHRVPGDMHATLQRAVTDVLTTEAPDMALKWPSGKLPTQAELAEQEFRGFFLGASLAKLDVRVSGGSAEIRCSVAVQVNPWEGSDGKQRLTAGSTASASGSGIATGRNTKSGIDQAKRDCVMAVAEQITAKKVVPFLQKLAAAGQ